MLIKQRNIFQLLIPFLIILSSLVLLNRYPRSNKIPEYEVNRTIVLSPALNQREVLCPIVYTKNRNTFFNPVLQKFGRALGPRWGFDERKSCQTFKQIRGAEPAISNEELKFPLAFSFNIHKDLNQFSRLLRAVYRKHNVYCIHLEKKAEWEIRQNVLELAKCFGSNVYVIPLNNSKSIRWATLGTLEAWVECARYFLRQSSVAWKYMLNGSGQEFPLRTNWELVKALKAINGSNIVESDRPNSGRGRAPAKPISFELTWYKGSMYTALKRDMVKFALTSKYAVEILNALRTEANRGKSQDELFFTTLNYNKHFNAPGACPEVHRPKRNDSRSMFVARYVEWRYTVPCSSSWSVRSVCVMGLRSIPILVNRREFFVNKFYNYFEPLAYDCLEWWLFDKLEHERKFGTTVEQFDASFYSKLYCSTNHL